MYFKKNSLKEIVKGKKVLFITTKNIDYIRNTQELRILRDVAQSVEVISSDKKNYALRVFAIWRQIKKSKVRQNEVVFIGFSPQLVIPFVGRRFKGKPIVMDFFISVYDTLVNDRKQFKDGSIFAKICHSLDNITLKEANHVITDTRAHANYFISEFHVNPNIFETIYLEADSTIYYPMEQHKSEERANKFVVLYFGSILPLQGINVVLEAIRNLNTHKCIYFDIIGPIPKKYNKPIQDNVSYTEWVSQKELAEHIANADLCLAGHFAADIDKAKRTIPGKAYIYEMMQKKMILGDNEATHERFYPDENHKFVNMGSVNELCQMIIECENIYERSRKKDN